MRPSGAVLLPEDVEVLAAGHLLALLLAQLVRDVLQPLHLTVVTN